MNAFMLHSPALVVGAVVLIALGWLAIVAFLPLEDEDIEDLNPWPPKYAGPPSHVHLVRGPFNWEDEIARVKHQSLADDRDEWG